MCRSVGPDETALLSSDALQSVTHDSADKRLHVSEFAAEWLRQEKRKDSSAPVVASTGIVIAVLATIEARTRCGQDHPIQKRFHSIEMTSGQRNATNAGLKFIRRRFWTRMRCVMSNVTVGSTTN